MTPALNVAMAWIVSASPVHKDNMALLTADDLRRIRTGKSNPVAPKKSRGLGDSVAKAIHRVSRGRIKPCGGCKKRQKRLNELIPY